MQRGLSYVFCSPHTQSAYANTNQLSLLCTLLSRNGTRKPDASLLFSPSKMAQTIPLSWDSLLVERQTRDRKVASLNLSTIGRGIFSSRVNILCWLIRCPFHPCVTAVACKRPRSFCERCRWQVIPKHAYTLDSTKSEWADYVAVQA